MPRRFVKTASEYVNVTWLNDIEWYITQGLADAAHAVTPSLGQGANLAFEDGLELALQLSSAPTLRCFSKTNWKI